VEEGSEDNQVPEVCVDYMYMTEKEEREEDRGMPILVVSGRRTNMTWAHVVPRKGKEGFAVKALARDLRLLGYPKVIMRTDAAFKYQTHSPNSATAALNSFPFHLL
jgi:hypothetical protein